MDKGGIIAFGIAAVFIGAIATAATMFYKKKEKRRQLLGVLIGTIVVPMLFSGFLLYKVRRRSQPKKQTTRRKEPQLSEAQLAENLKKEQLHDFRTTAERLRPLSNYYSRKTKKETPQEFYDAVAKVEEIEDHKGYNYLWKQVPGTQEPFENHLAILQDRIQEAERHMNAQAHST